MPILTANFALFVTNGDMYLRLMAWRMYKLKGKQLQIPKFQPCILTDIRSAALMSGPLYLKISTHVLHTWKLFQTL